MTGKNQLGKQTRRMENDVMIIGEAAIGSTKEAEGPLGGCLDKTMPDIKWGEDTFEKAECKLQSQTILQAICNAKKRADEIDAIFAGDLLNQCISSSYASRDTDIPFYGLYGACSTMAESLSLGSMMVDGGYAQNVVCGTSSHFYSAERQYRFPVEYGGQRPPTAQWTVTGSGMAVLSNEGQGPFVTHITSGKIVDKGICDANNMGAAMAPAAVDTLLAHFNDTGRKPSDYDLIVTGDLGSFGKNIVLDLMKKNGYDLSDVYDDCGVKIFNLKEQNVECGGSGCGCSAVVLCAHLLKEIRSGNINRLLFIGTGALMSPLSCQQGESIPAIAHAVAISSSREGE